MHETFRAVYENGRFRPLDGPRRSFAEGEEVRLTAESMHTMDDVLKAAVRVYRGLTERDVDEIETIALDRSRFFSNGT